MQSSSNRKAPIVSFWSRFPSAVATVPLRVTTHVRTPSCFKSPKLYHKTQYQHVILHPIQDQYSIFWNTSIIVFQCSHLALCTLQQTTNQIKKRDKITITTCEYTRFSPLFLNTITAHIHTPNCPDIVHTCGVQKVYLYHRITITKSLRHSLHLFVRSQSRSHKKNTRPFSVIIIPLFSQVHLHGSLVYSFVFSTSSA